MKRFGPATEKMGSPDEKYIFLQRLSLLIVVVKAALKGYPQGGLRKKAALENASRLNQIVSDIDLSFLKLTTSHLFKERVKLLSVMAAAIVSDDYPLGVHRREAVLDNIEQITEIVFPTKNFEFLPDILKVA